MKSIATFRPARWAVPLAAFGFAATLAAYAVAKLPNTGGGAPKATATVATPNTGGGAPKATATVGATSTAPLEVSIASLEKRATADAKRLQALEVAVRNLEYAVAHLPKPPPSTAPFCQSFSVSANPQGGTRNCEPYKCDGATGVCLSGTCGSVDDCAVGWICNAASHCDAPAYPH